MRKRSIGKGAGKRTKWRQPHAGARKGRTEFLQRESEWLELMNAELKTQMEELKQEWQQLILRLNRHRQDRQR
ncbi:hypothetical protein QTO34_007908 [Cnephaeus nilssonii]|uniref:Uncharacterized protein n=1 Tax=Cnephaeus nilssonii TaxID=3371016 RepID=A0AA40LTA5_CNENI|nr:hypothetical protein QTO34_007908 [Eptesicus nilssonii]